MRFVAVAGLCCVLSTPAFALDAAGWQSQLQAEMDRLQQRSAMMKVEGPVKVSEEGNQMVAHLPVMTITAADQSVWKLPAVTMNAPAGAGKTAQVTINLPSHISYKDANGQERSAIAIGEQNLAGMWDFNANGFESLNGELKNVEFTDKGTNTRSSVALIALRATNPSQPSIAATDMQSSSTKNGKVVGGSMAKATVGYQFAGNDKLSIPRVIGLLNPVWLLAENQNFTLTSNASQLSMTDSATRVTSIGTMTSHVEIMPQQGGKILAANTSFDLGSVAQMPESVYGFVLSQKLRVVAKLKNMPVQMLSFGPGQAFEIAKKAAAKAGMQADIQEIAWDTYHSAKLNGQGSLKAAENVPLGMTGRLTFNLTDLQALTTALQQQISKPGVDMKLKSQGMLLMMVLQGLGKQDSNVTRFEVDLTEDGQVLVNGNNMAGLLPGGQKPASPVAGLGGALQGLIAGGLQEQAAGR